MRNFLLPLSSHFSNTLTILNIQNIENFTNSKILGLLEKNLVKHHELETLLKDPKRAVEIRRQFIEKQAISIKNSPFSSKSTQILQNLPYKDLDYSKILGRNCENVIGYVPIPVGVVGPLLLNDKNYFIPFATTEGTLVASTTRGCRALSSGKGVKSYVVKDGMTRAPVLQCKSLQQGIEISQYCEANFSKLAEIFNKGSNHVKLQSPIKTTLAGRKIFLRFKAITGDAMGMNMVSKGATQVIDHLVQKFSGLRVISVSGNMCIDKKPSAINFIEGRGKTVCAEAVISKQVVNSILKTTVDDLVQLNVDKNFLGSALAGSIGGNNAHAANIVSAIFLATGQDPAQNVESSACVNVMEKTSDGDLYFSVLMPSLEVGTIGGGTHLHAQSTCLKLLGEINGANHSFPGQNSKTLANVIAGTVMAGELSLMSALCEGSLMRAHEKLNRKKE